MTRPSLLHVLLVLPHLSTSFLLLPSLTPLTLPTTNTLLSSRLSSSSSDTNTDSSGDFAASLAALNKQFSSSPSSPDSSDDGGLGDYFSVPSNIGVSTDAWTSSPSFVSSPSSKKPAKGTWSPGDLLSAASTLSPVSPFVATAENHKHCEELLGLLPLDPSPLVSTTFTPTLLSLRKDTTKAVQPNSRSTPSSPPKLRLPASAAPPAALRSSLDRLSATQAELYLLDLTPRKSLYLYPLNTAVRGMVKCKKLNLAKHIGVKGIKGGKAVRKWAKIFENAGGKMEALEVDFSAVDRGILYDGTQEACKDLDITILCTNPLGPDSIGSGFYTALDPTGGETGKPRFAFADLDRLLPLHQALRNVAEIVTARLKDGWDDQQAAMKSDPKSAATGAPSPPLITTTAVAINYVISKGLVALPSCTSTREAGEVRAAVEWKLEREEVAVVDRAAGEVDGGE